MAVATGMLLLLGAAATGARPAVVRRPVQEIERRDAAPQRSRVRRGMAAIWLTALVVIVGGLGSAWLAGWRLDVVETASMSPEVPPGSLAVVVPTRPSAVTVGDVVVFADPSNPQRSVMHRVVDVVVVSGERFLKTQGDANATADPALISARSVSGRLLTSLPRLGVFVTALQPPVGAVVFLGVPLAVIVGSAFRRRRKNLQT